MRVFPRTDEDMVKVVGNTWRVFHSQGKGFPNAAPRGTSDQQLVYLYIPVLFTCMLTVSYVNIKFMSEII